jgi:type VI protein secretion system component Hcp
MDKSNADIVMKFVLEGKPVFAECTLDIASDDTLMKDFLPARNNQSSYANFFEVSDFDLAISLKESDDVGGRSGARSAGAQAAGGAFARWRSAANADYKSIYYPLEFDNFNFERIIDRASPIFFQSCCKSQSFESAALVKRIAQGNKGGVTRPAVGFLRIDFTNVLITGIDWSDGDVIKERCEFICQKMQITYRKQRSDGTVSVGFGNEFTATWPNPEKDRSLGIRG